MIQIILTYLTVCLAITYSIAGLYNAVKKKEKKSGCNCNSSCGDLKRDIMKMKKLNN